MLLFNENYRRLRAVLYARRWALGRNPAYYDYSDLGGDCTNFVSQCVYAGCGVMNYTPDFGWYYISADDKAPAWTGVEFFYRFFTRAERSPGPVAQLCSVEELQVGDVVQISFDGESYAHTVVVVKVEKGEGPGGIFIAAHTNDALNRPLDSYDYQSLRCLHITGYWS